MLDEYQAQQLKVACEEAGAECRINSVATGAGPAGGHHANMLAVEPTRVHVAARVIVDLYELDDPARAEPYTGACPACGADVSAAWECPDCELGFRAAHAADDPLIVFLREHRGFR